MTTVVRIFRLFRFTATLIGHSLVLQITARTQKQFPPVQHSARALQNACRSLIRILKIDVETKGGVESLESPGLIVSNHLGIVDPLILGSQLRIAFAAKSEMRNWPVMGTVCRSVGTIFVNRDRRMATRQFVDEVVSRLKDDVSVLVFPEGTTSSGETIRKFKTGSFEAMTHLPNRRIVPVLLAVKSVNGKDTSDDRQVLSWYKKGQSLFANFWQILGIRSAHVELMIGQPINVGAKARKELAGSAYEEMLGLHASANSSAGKIEPIKQ